MSQQIAIVIDGNGQWVTQRKLPGMAEAVCTIVASCSKRGIGYRTLFAFSSEHSFRPRAEVPFLMCLFTSVLSRETARLDKHGIRLRVVRDRRCLTQDRSRLLSGEGASQ
ncbi:undecaprenyl diphosphate synthase family protein [Paraburkholderia tagetis]|uniref:Undecaprenyl diphosphate synthase family protein n=1 Tax=Paraburkholderia tagetis TaxID=2913261 RepID=A0A9X1RU28_9BURK|nr:undecaprenyl diphosphate synthase family protein [Paraburkholderia tagetis]